MNNKSLAIFVSNRFVCSNRWVLFEDRLEFTSYLFLIKKRYVSIFLKDLKPVSASFSRRNFWLGACVVLLILDGGLLVYCALRLPLSAEMQRYFYPEKFTIFFCLYAVLGLLFAIIPDEYLGISGETPLYIKYYWWQRKRAKLFGKSIVDQIIKINQTN